VGDDYRIDICGAREAGLHPVWIKHHLVKRNWPDVDTVVPVISSLDKLLGLERLFSR
jgi:FMN phosphatase YigB (HAD superfamily)